VEAGPGTRPLLGPSFTDGSIVAVTLERPRSLRCPDASAKRYILRLARRRRGLCPRRFRTRRGLSRSGRLPARGPRPAWLVARPGLDGRHRTFPGRRDGGGPSSGPPPPLRRRSRDEGRRGTPCARRVRLVHRGSSLATLCRDTPERRRLDHDGRRGDQCDRRTMVRPGASRRTRCGV
jgi:hypothetical protein